MQVEEQPKARTKSALREFVETVLITLLIYILIRTFLFENYRVLGHSMDPTLADSQYLVVNKLIYRLQDPQRGDIIVLHDTKDDARKLIKRVIGLPGETIEIRAGQVLVDGQALNEPYIARPAGYSQPATEIPAGQYYVLGDNRNNSSDSHNWGTLPEGKIVGKAWLSYWPVSRWGIIPHETYEDVSSAQVDDGFFGESGSGNRSPGPPADAGARGNQNKSNR